MGGSKSWKTNLGTVTSMKILNIVGARPNFMKIAPIMEHMKTSSKITPVLLHTGQHYDNNMSAQFFDELDIPTPRYHLNIGSGPHGAQTGQMLGAIEEVLLAEKPDYVLVYGDTNSTLAGALAASWVKNWGACPQTIRCCASPIYPNWPAMPTTMSKLPKPPPLTKP